MAQAGTLAVTFCLRTVPATSPQSRKETAFPGRVFLPRTAFPAAESRELAEACRRERRWLESETSDPRATSVIGPQ